MNANQDSSRPALNLADTAATNGTFNIFLQAVDKAGLKEVLSGVGPHTVLAPTDAAFDKLPVGRLDELYQPDNQAELADIINYHVIRGRRTSSELGKWSTARTAHGQEAPISRDGGKVTIDGANITMQDMDSTNGILHGIDKVNIPDSKSNASI
ncbi:MULTISPECIES: fasciclin domain-containing protein [Lysobacter]|uniref:Fasciclin domain protein n=2 Tax=Lysobacter TaxID=68 RepID=A0A0S2DLA4_LYSEN|nr:MULTISPECIES: fasciclin domain-containing protein [Lysobacter]ALN59370.1 fasciclin domain protein [Lysobacter enzymogenes]QCW27540.1 fasciclin domain-containing protein [Lysobacter enzymogenes]QQQ00838.1 fasciclin domain-containing protein [Lysobacter enzymogenes]UZW61895.1 fasciclin domain-containing protein [Lysobacter enzymogenes]WMT04127.1 fasciclin domain-containing protein [Lysobacter yananisis]